jgi:hypothetical protein
MSPKNQLLQISRGHSDWIALVAVLAPVYRSEIGAHVAVASCVLCRLHVAKHTKCDVGASLH